MSFSDDYFGKAKVKRKLGMKSDLKTHCKYGHPYSGENLYLTSEGRRQCRECRKRNTQGYWRKQNDT
jgi:hypothetical protein